MYLIKNEFGESMRVVSRQEEARAICSLRLGWYFKKVKKPNKIKELLTNMEDALI
jgi:hypothetical protein